MAHYLFILSPEHPLRGELSAGQLGRRVAESAQWFQSLRASGELRGGLRLRPAGVRLARPAADRSHWEASEAAAVSGCLLIHAADVDEAIGIASSCPAVGPGCIELYEVDAGTELGALFDLCEGPKYVDGHTSAEFEPAP